MTVSLNEVAATAKRAARGAGLSWGQAEEVSFAVQWLCRNGVDGCKALAQYLTLQDGADWGKQAPDLTGPVWQAEAGNLCPILAGTALSDGYGLRDGGSVRLGAIACPALILPFAALTARACQTIVAVTGDGFEAATDGMYLSLQGDAMQPSASGLTIAPNCTLTDPEPQHSRAAPEPDDWQSMLRFAHRTYAPATEASRQLGAGAGLSDND